MRRAAAVGKLREAIQRRTRQLSDEDPTDKPVYAEDFDEDADEDSDDAFSKKGMRRAREETKIQVRRLKRASKVVDIEGSYPAFLLAVC